MRWERTTRCDSRACAMADRHYSRTVIGAPQVGGNGCLVVLMTPEANALWITRYDRYPKHGFGDVWQCALFRNESPHLASELIAEAEAATHYLWGNPPPGGFLTFVNADAVRRKRDPGRCYRKAGWVPCGETKGGLLALRHEPLAIPAPVPPLNELLLGGAA